MSAYDTMLQTCLNGLNQAERREISIATLCRIVRLCADTVTEPNGDDDPFPALNYIKAWTLKIIDYVWRPELTRFATVTRTDSDLAVGLMYVEFDVGEPAWFGSDDLVEIPMNREHAHEWTVRRRLVVDDGATPATDR